MQHQDQPPSQVCLRVAQAFGVTEAELYRTWQGYCAQRAFDNDPHQALDRMRMMPASFAPAAIDYFAAMGLEMFSREMKEKIDGK